MIRKRRWWWCKKSHLKPEGFLHGFFFPWNFHLGWKSIGQTCRVLNWWFQRFFSRFETCKAVDVANVATLISTQGFADVGSWDTQHFEPVHLFGDVFLTWTRFTCYRIEWFLRLPKWGLGRCFCSSRLIPHFFWRCAAAQIPVLAQDKLKWWIFDSSFFAGPNSSIGSSTYATQCKNGWVFQLAKILWTIPHLGEVLGVSKLRFAHFQRFTHSTRFRAMDELYNIGQKVAQVARKSPGESPHLQSRPIFFWLFVVFL